MDMDIAILQQVEDLERRVASASLQIKVKCASVKPLFGNVIAKSDNSKLLRAAVFTVKDKCFSQ